MDHLREMVEVDIEIYHGMLSISFGELGELNKREK